MAKRTRVKTASGEWVDLASSVTDLTQYANLTNTPVSGFRNKIINGGFDIWQRGETFNAIAGGTYCADRWLVGFKDAGITLNVTKQNFTSGNTPSVANDGAPFLQLANTAFTTGNTYYFGQKIEDVRTFSNQTVTVSYWARVTSGTLTATRVFLNQQFGTGGSAEVDNIGANQPTYTTTWQKFTYTVTVPSVYGKTIGTGSSLYVLWQITPNANITLQIWGVQLEAGSIATPFEQRPIGTELALCHRYYWQPTEIRTTGGTYATAVTYCPIQVPVSMRATPAVTGSTTGNTNYLTAAGGFTAVASIIVQAGISPTTIVLIVNSGQASWTAVNIQATGIQASAEL